MPVFHVIAFIALLAERPALEIKGLGIGSSYSDMIVARLGTAKISADGCTFEDGGRKLCIFRNGTLAGQVTDFRVNIVYDRVCSITAEFSGESTAIVQKAFSEKYGEPDQPDQSGALTWVAGDDSLQVGGSMAFLHNAKCEEESEAMAAPSKDI